MAEGREVVEDYGHIGLTLRRHPVSFLREELQGRGVISCAQAERLRDGRRCQVAGLVLVRQKPGSAKGVMFITIEDETGIANLVVWPQLFEKPAPAHPVRRHDLGGGPRPAGGRDHSRHRLLAPRPLDRAQRRGRSVRRLVSIPRGRGDGATHGAGPDPRSAAPPKVRDIYVPDLRLGSGIKVPTRDFR